MPSKIDILCYKENTKYNSFPIILLPFHNMFKQLLGFKIERDTVKPMTRLFKKKSKYSLSISYSFNQLFSLCTVCSNQKQRRFKRIFIVTFKPAVWISRIYFCFHFVTVCIYFITNFSSCIQYCLNVSLVVMNDVDVLEAWRCALCHRDGPSYL